MSAPSPELREAFAGRSVFVTGHTGFKGSWLTLWLAQLGAEVTGYSLPPPTTPSLFEAAGVRSPLRGHHEGDVRDGPRLLEALHRADADVVFHLAAQPLVRASYEAPGETFDVNVVGTARLLDAVRAVGRPCVVIVVTSDKCYENVEQVWGYRESDALGGHDPYSASKGAAELVVTAYRRSFFGPRTGIRLASGRAGNVIGGGDWARDRIITDAAAAISAGVPVPVRNPRAVRPWQHVLEPLSGYLTLAARLLSDGAPALQSAFNFGPWSGDEATVGELMDRFCRAWGSGTWVDASQADAPHEAHTLRLSIDKARTVLGWKPRWHLDEAVARTARWYRRFYEGRGDMLRACLEDLAAFSEVVLR